MDFALSMRLAAMFGYFYDIDWYCLLCIGWSTMKLKHCINLRLYGHMPKRVFCTSNFCTSLRVFQILKKIQPNGFNFRLLKWSNDENVITYYRILRNYYISYFIMQFKKFLFAFPDFSIWSHNKRPHLVRLWILYYCEISIFDTISPKHKCVQFVNHLPKFDTRILEL